MQAWAVILIVLVILCSASSVAATFSLLNLEKGIEKSLAEGVAGLGRDAARAKVLANAKKENIEFERIVVQDDAVCRDPGVVVVEVKNGKATGVVNFCLSET